jgi:transcriptional regulator with XRE-family HTH domain
MKTVDQILENIFKIRKRKGYSQENMAYDMGIDITTYGKIERGKISLTVNRLEQIAKVLKVKVSDLYPSLISNESMFEGKFKIVRVDSLDKNLEDLQALKNQL